MRLFLDTANIDEIREINDWGVLKGVTTNPTLLAREHGDIEKAWRTILELVDVGADGMHALRQICEIYEIQGYQTNVLAASLRHPMHVIDAALAGADIATMPYDVFAKLVKHPLTDKGLESFEKDWKQLQEELKQGKKGA